MKKSEGGGSRARRVRVHVENAEFQVALALRESRAKRQKQRLAFVESVACINALKRSEWPVWAFLYDEERLSGWARETLATVEAQRHLVLTETLMRKLSERNDPSELLAIVRMPPDDLARIKLVEQPLIVVIDRPSSPGNLGTIVRSADAFGAQGVVVSGHAADPFDPQAVRASLGALFTTPVVRVASSQAIESWLQALRGDHGVRVVGTSARADRGPDDQDFVTGTVLLLGNESHGLSAHYRSLCDDLVSIPQRGIASSLNVASAAAVLLYEIDRQRRRRRL